MAPKSMQEGCLCMVGHVANINCTAPGLQVVGFKDQEPEGCGCVKREDFALEEHIPVQVGALRFCEAAVRDAHDWVQKDYDQDIRHWDETVEYWVDVQRRGAAEVCQNILAKASKENSKIWKLETSKFKKLFKRFKKFWKGTGFGRMAPLQEEATSGDDRKAWKEALHHVCHDECKQLVKQTMKEMEEMTLEDVDHGISPTRSCASRVVQKVEAETFTCCAKACGWNNITCLWPFLNKSQRIQWEAECCSEWNILNGSSRQSVQAGCARAAWCRHRRSHCRPGV